MKPSWDVCAGNKVGTFKEVEASHLKFRGFPDFDPVPYLDPVSRSIYASPFEHAQELAATRKSSSFTSSWILPTVQLYTKDQVRLRFGSGVFAVLKSLEAADCLILDSRPRNLLESPPGRFIRSLGSADPLYLLHLQAGETLYMSSHDIRDFYHLFKVSVQSCRGAGGIVLLAASVQGMRVA